MLRATARVLKPGGVTVFHVIRLGSTPDAEIEATRRDVGPSLARRDDDLPELMRSAGLRGVEAEDVTPEFRETMRLWHEGYATFEKGLVESMGREDYEEIVAGRERDLKAIDDGLLRRTRYVGRR